MGRKRQSPIIRGGSGDSHEARLAVLEKRFPDDLRARCSWCDQVEGAKQGKWFEVLLSTPGTGVCTSHVFRCEQCETTVGQDRAVTGANVLAIPTQSLEGAGQAGKLHRGRPGERPSTPALPQTTGPVSDDGAAPDKSRGDDAAPKPAGRPALGLN